MNILLTGGTGYIGSHIALTLIKSGFKVILLDNLANSKKSVLDSLENICGLRPPFVRGDVRDVSKLEAVFSKYHIDGVIHLAGLKAVGESVAKPITYYDNNIVGTISLVKAMSKMPMKTLIFSSSATVYGDPKYLPIDENHLRLPRSPYGRSKLQIEDILADVAKSDSSWRIACLRYFNPVGAHDSGLIGESPNEIPNNLVPYIAQVADGRLPYLKVFGNDYNTRDGTGVRDYIHVMDLAEGHIAALDFLQHHAGWHAINLGTGIGYSVLEMVNTFERVSGKTIPYLINERRAGDVDSCYAGVDKAHDYLGWSASRTIEDMCSSIWRFQLNNRLDNF